MHDITCTGTTAHITCTSGFASDIHWGVIFSNAGYLAGLFLIAGVLIAFARAARKQKTQAAEVKRLGYGDQVSVQMKNGDVLTGYVRSATSNGPGVTILCSKDAP